MSRFSSTTRIGGARLREGELDGMTVLDPSRRFEAAADLGAALASVEGWLYDGEAWALHCAARDAAARKDRPVIVEIGSWKGRSTVALGLGLTSTTGRGIVYAIDPHCPTTELHVAEYGNVDTFAEFNANVEGAGVAHVVHALRTTSVEARPSIPDGSVDVLFIDGSHHYEDVRTDIDTWVSAVADGATVAFNDPSRAGVYRALRERVLRDQRFRSPRLIDNTLFFRFETALPPTPADAASARRLRWTLRGRAAFMPVRPYMPMWFVRLGHRVSRAMVSKADR